MQTMKMRLGRVNSHLTIIGVLLVWQHRGDESRGTVRKAASIAALLLVGTMILCIPEGFAKEKKPPTKTVSGDVLDPAENGIEGAAVELTDLQTGKVLAIYSQEKGQYQFAGLLPSHDYTIKATFKGSSSEVRQVSSVDIRSRLVLNLTIPAPKQ
jgi:Carboxypeptidase regulatory-like domain